MKNSYWSCSKFADWLRGTPKPQAGNTEEWNTWEKTAKVKKNRYWLAENGLDFLQSLVYWPLYCFNKARHYFDNRWIAKTHALTSNLKRGQFYDFDNRLLHALFDELVNFVEVELASHFISCSEVEFKKYETPWYRKVFPLKSWRCPKAGLAYLEWAVELKKDEDWVDKEDLHFGQPTPQALAAQETLTLYKWWKKKRPGRPDPMEASGWNVYYEEKRQAAEARGYDHWIDCDIHESDKERSCKISEFYHKIEQEQEDEDTEMLIRLIKVRTHLWT